MEENHAKNSMDFEDGFKDSMNGKNSKNSKHSKESLYFIKHKYSEVANAFKCYPLISTVSLMASFIWAGSILKLFVLDNGDVSFIFSSFMLSLAVESICKAIPNTLLSLANQCQKHKLNASNIAKILTLARFLSLKTVQMSISLVLFTIFALIIIHNVVPYFNDELSYDHHQIAMYHTFKHSK